MQKEVKLKEASKAIVTQKVQHERTNKAQLQERKREAAKEARAVSDLKRTLKNKEKVSH